MTSIDQVSQQLGSLSARVDEALRQNTAIFMKMDKANEELIEQRGAIKLLGAQFVDHKLIDVAEHTKFNIATKELDAFKNRGKGIAIGFGLLGGGGGIAGIITALKVFMAGGGN